MSQREREKSMGKVGIGFSMSLDGFIAGPNDDVQQVFKWYFSGDTEFEFPGGMGVKISQQSADLLQEQIEATGALVTGRRQFDLTHGWGGRHPLDVPVFVVTHSVPEGWDKEGSPFTFVTDGVVHAVELAQAAAGDKMVVIDGASIVQQSLQAGLVDLIGVDLVPVLLGQGVRFFDHLEAVPVKLEIMQVVEAPGVTHLRYRVVK
jgi:dihydrofolate reductase